MGTKPAIGGRKVFPAREEWRALRRAVTVVARVVLPGQMVLEAALVEVLGMIMWRYLSLENFESLSSRR